VSCVTPGFMLYGAFVFCLAFNAPDGVRLNPASRRRYGFPAVLAGVTKFRNCSRISQPLFDQGVLIDLTNHLCVVDFVHYFGPSCALLFIVPPVTLYVFCRALLIAPQTIATNRI